MLGFSLALMLIPILISLWVCRSVAKKKGLSQRYWQVMALIFGPLAIPFVLFAKPASEKKEP